jgi:hypothetical protein
VGEFEHNDSLVLRYNNRDLFGPGTNKLLTLIFRISMGTHLERQIAFGRLQIDMNELKTCAQMWNFASGYHTIIEFNADEFGQLQDFGQTLEQLFFLFAHQNGCKVVGFDSSTKVSDF